MSEAKSQKITVRFPIEDYGWIMRYGEKNGMTASQVLRKALRTYQMAVAAKAKQKTKEQE